MWTKVYGRTKELIMILSNEKNNIPKSVLAKMIGTHRVYLHRIYSNLEKSKIIVNGRINKKKVKFKKMSVEILKKQVKGSLLGLIISFVVSIPFYQISPAIILGAIIVFTSHALYVLYDLMKTKENIEVFIDV